MHKATQLAFIGLVTIFGLSACNQSPADDAATQEQTEVVPTKPTDAADTKGWQAYISYIVKQNLSGMTASRPYVYFVPTGDEPEIAGQRDRQLVAVQGVVARTVLPGNLIAFAGPDSATTAEFITKAFSIAEKGSFENVIILFIGDSADKVKVGKALAASGATYRFVEM